MANMINKMKNYRKEFVVTLAIFAALPHFVFKRNSFIFFDQKRRGHEVMEFSVLLDFDLHSEMLIIPIQDRFVCQRPVLGRS